MRRPSRDWVLRRRLATQHLTSARLPTPTEAVRLLLAVQCQDAPLASFSLGMRSRPESYAGVLADQAAGGYVRLHILRPTWHYVAREDVRWLLGLTSAAVERGMAARHRGLALDEATIGRGLAALTELLGGGNALTRKEIGPLMVERGLPGPGERVGHLLLLAELRGLVCSGPPRGAEHTYLRVDEVVPPDRDPPADRDEALGRLAVRFFAGHGPAQITDLTRYAAVNQGEVRRGLAVAGDALESVEVDGVTLWHAPGAAPRSSRPARALLLPVFDEAFLTYPHLNLPRTPGNPLNDRAYAFNEAGGGIVMCDLRDVGAWKRSVRAGTVDVRLTIDEGLDRSAVEAIDEQVERLRAFSASPPPKG